MVNDIINVFERKFNKFADTTDAFTTRFIRDEDSAIGTLCFNRFNVEFEYSLECGGTVEKSGLNIIVDFSKRSDLPLRCMMYDIIGLFDRDNFSCWFYCFIENERRMELCFDRLADDFTAVLPKLKEFFSKEESEKMLEEQLRKNVLATVGIDFAEDFNRESIEPDALDEVYDYLFGLYFGFEQCAFASDEYRDFLAGDYKKALKKYQKKKNKLVYEDRLMEYMVSCDEPEPILTEEYECLKDGLKEYKGTSGFVPYFASCGMLLIPFLAVCIGMYYAISGILYHSALYASPLELYNAVSCIIPALFCSFAAAYFLKERIFRKFFKSKYQKMQDYDAIFNSDKSKKRTRVILYLFYLVALIFVFLNATNGISIFDSGVKVNSHYFDVTKNFYGYDDIDFVEIEESEAGKKILIYPNDSEDGINISAYADDNDAEKKILPLLKQGGIEIIRSDTE